VNEHLFTSNHGLRLITQFEGAPRLKARLCEGGRHELSYGVTFHIDGRPVAAGETCTDDYAMAMFRNALGTFEDAVKRHAKVELTQFQFDALVAFFYNVGEANGASSTVLKETNARRYEDAAAAFSMWIFASRDGWKQAYRGLLRRRLAEATLYLGYDWVQATSDDAIALQKLPPPGNPPKGADRVTYKTPFLEVLRVAQHYPLNDSQIATHAQVPVLVPTQPERIEVPSAVNLDSPLAREATIDGIPVQLPLPGEEELVLTEEAAASETIPDTKAAAPSPPQPEVEPTAHSVSKSDQQPSNSVGPMSATVEKPAAASASPPAAPAPLPPPPKPIVIAPKSIDIKAIPYGDVSPDNGAKNASETRRVLGMVIVGAGSFVQILAGREIVSSTIGAVFYDMSRDPVIIALVVGFICMVGGWLTRKRGTHIMTKGFMEATQVMK
jgi:lysozyme